MAHLGGQYGHQTDEYGNPIHQTQTDPVLQTDQYGNPIHQTGTGATVGSNIQGHHGGGTTQLHRSGSGSSSSSSEDDGHGGRRKKGIKEKIKEKLPGAHKHGTPTTTAGAYQSGEVEEPHEKKGVMEKIKEKLPGGHH